MKIRFAALFALLTLVALPGAALAADARPNSCSSATTNSAHNTWLEEAIDSSTDVDWYRFSITEARYVLLTLGNLPANYRLDLYSTCSTLLASSNSSAGTGYEQLYRRMDAGTYRVKVSGVLGAYHATSRYALKFRPLSSTVQVLSSSTWTDEYGYLNVAGEVLNNTSGNREYVQITGTYYDSANRVVGTGFTYTDNTIVKARTRSPFKIVDDKPAGYHHLKLTVSSASTTASPVAGLKVVGGIAYTDEWGYRYNPGEVTNTNSFTARYVMVSATYYNRAGSVFNTEFTFTNPFDIGARKTAPYEIVTDRWAGLNRLRISVDAFR